MNALSKARLVEILCDDLALTKPDARAIIDAFFEAIHDALEQGHDVKLSGFGNFILRDKTARPGRNPKTGELIPVTARRVVTFKPGNKLKKAVQSNES